VVEATPQLAMAVPFQFVIEFPYAVPLSRSKIPLALPLLMLVKFVGHVIDPGVQVHTSPDVPKMNWVHGAVPDGITKPEEAEPLFSSSSMVEPVPNITLGE
jgi:hypothetical protein